MPLNRLSNAAGRFFPYSPYSTGIYRYSQARRSPYKPGPSSTGRIAEQVPGRRCQLSGSTGTLHCSSLRRAGSRQAQLRFHVPRDSDLDSSAT